MATTLRFRTVITAAAAIMLLLWVALANGGPILYPDTYNYIDDGQKLVRLQWPGGARPIFYGIVIELLDWERTVWPVLAVQAAIVGHLLMLTAKGLGLRLRPMQMLAVAAATAFLTPLSWYVAHLMPDVFTGVLVLAFFLLTFCRNQFSRGEIVYLFALTTAAISFHLSHLALAGFLCIGSWALRLAWRVGRPVLGTAALALAVAGLLASSMVFYRTVSLTPKSPPHFMSRLIADGPGRDYLRIACQDRAFRICADLDRLPATEEGVMWDYVGRLPAAQSTQVRAEAGEVVRGTLVMFPAQVAWHMLENTAKQLLTITTELDIHDGDWERLIDNRKFLERAAENTHQMRGVLTNETLVPFNRLHAFIAIASLLAGMVLARQAIEAGLRRPALLLGTVLAALLANAFITGALGGVFGRFEGRLIWVLPVGVMFAALAVAGRQQRGAVVAAAQRA